MTLIKGIKIMPGRVDEAKWNRAKKIVASQKGGVHNRYALVNHIYQNMGGEFHSTKKSLGEKTMGSQYEKIMNDHKLTHQDLVKSMLAEVAGESALEKGFSSKAIAGAKRLGTKALKHMKTHKGNYIAGGIGAGIGTVVGVDHLKRYKKKTNKLDAINDMCKGILGRGMMAATRGVRRVGSGVENLGSKMYASRIGRSGVARPKNIVERGISRIGGAMRTATPRQVAIGAGVAGAGAAGAYGLHRRNQNRRQG